MKKQDFYNLGAETFSVGNNVDGWSTSSWQGIAVRQGWEDAKIEARRQAVVEPNPCHMVCVEPVRVPAVSTAAPLNTDCAEGLHSWVDDPSFVSGKCAHCGEDYGCPEGTASSPDEDSEKTLNQQVAELLAVDLAETPAVTALLEKLGADEEGDGGDHACCWRGYIKDHFPAGGLWLELDKWKDSQPESDAYRLHHPDVVAYMLDNDGDTPDHIDELLYGEVRYVEVDGSKYSFDDHHVQYLEEGEEDKRGNYEFWFYHRLAEPDAETVKQLIISQTAFEAKREAEKEAAQNAN